MTAITGLRAGRRRLSPQSGIPGPRGRRPLTTSRRPSGQAGLLRQDRSSGPILLCVLPRWHEIADDRDTGDLLSLWGVGRAAGLLLRRLSLMAR